MAYLKIDADNGLYYVHTPPASAEGKTFVFVNALTSSTAVWEGEIGEQLRAAGHGTLSFNLRGQPDSPFAAGMRLDARLIVADIRRLLSAVAPGKVVFVGQSIGGLFAMQAWLEGLEGAEVEGLVLVNTLRCDGPRLRWINDAVLRAAEVGGLVLFRDLFAPLVFNEEWLENNRESSFGADAYQPLPAESGFYQLLAHANSADWGFPYEQLTMPVLVVTGTQDRVFRDPEHVDRLYARIPRARRVDMADAGHMLPVERPQALVRELIQFAREV